jgi:DNA-binding transcriptional ArsR family regulator
MGASRIEKPAGSGEPHALLPESRGAASKTGAAALVEAFGVLANAQRVGLLRILREPHTASEIHLSPSEARRGQRPERPMSIQAVRKHLDKLLEHGFIVPVPGGRHGSAAEAYVLNHARLYALAEEMRQLASLRPLADSLGETQTQQLTKPPEARRSARPRLLVVHGLQEGHGFALGSGPTVIGRARGCDVRLDYDPFVSQEHAAMRRDAQGWILEDLGSRNGTQVNWLAIVPRGSVRVAHGDVISVGRTLLLLWA